MSQLQTIMHVWNFGLALSGSPKFLTGTSPGTTACMDWHHNMKTQNYWFESEFFILLYFCWCVCGEAQPEIQPTSSWQQCWAVLWSFKESSVWFFKFQNQRTNSSSSLKNIQNQRIVHSSCFKKPDRMDGLHERTGKELMILWPVLWLFKQFENHYYTPKPFIWKFWELAGKWIYTWVDNRWASVPHPKNCPTQVGTPCWFKVCQVADVQGQ